MAYTSTNLDGSPMRAPAKRAACRRLSRGESPEVIRATHRAKMDLKRSLMRVADVNAWPCTRNDGPAYRKGIWPAAKVARRSAA